MRSPPFSLRPLRQPCHCEPVTDVTGVAIRFPSPRHSERALASRRIFAPKVCKAESKCEDSSTPLRSARNDTELALRRVGNGFIRSVCGMHSLRLCVSLRGQLAARGALSAQREKVPLGCNPFPSISRNPIPQTHNRSRSNFCSGFSIFPATNR